jgi:HK97 family phage portal protein
VFGNAVKHTRGFVNGLRRYSSDAGQRNASEGIIRLEPAGKNLPEKRSTGTFANPSQSLINILAPNASSGAAVNETTALGVSAYLACVRLISDMIAKLPVELLKDTTKGPQLVTDHPAAWLVSKIPGELHTPFELKKMIMTGKAMGGNGYARVFREANFEPRSIQWIRPCDVTPKLIRRGNGEIFPIYEVAGTKEQLTSSDIIHVRGDCVDGINGISPVQILRESIGTSISQTQAAGKLMKNGTHFPGFLVSQAMLKGDQLTDARNEFNSRYAGAVNAGTIPVLNGNFDFKQTNGMSMVDAQFIESRRFELQEICRVFGVQPFLVGDSTASTTWGTGIQEMTLGFLNFCLDPHLMAFEESLDRTLLTTAERRQGYYFKFDRDELASVSRQDTAAYFSTMRNIGVYSVNDIRAKLDEPLISKEDGGDTYGLPLASNATTATAPVPALEEPDDEEL